MPETDLETRLQRWKEEFELLYILAKDDALEALEDCRQIHVSHYNISSFERACRRAR